MPPLFTTRQRRHLLAHRHHLGAGASDPLTVARDLVLLHSTDPATPYLGLRARVDGFEVRHLEQALLEDRSLWRLHSIRRTLFIVPAEDGALVQGAAGWEVARRERTRMVKWIEDAEGGKGSARRLARMEGATLEALSGGAEMRTQELTAAVPGLDTRITLGSGKWTTSAPLSSRLLFLMAMEGKIVRTRTAGSWRASQYLWARTDEWFGDGLHEGARIPTGKGASGVEASARAGLVRAYLTAFGPVRFEDVQWWTGWTKGKTEKALAGSGAMAIPLEEGGEGLILPETLDEAPALAETSPFDGHVTFLPALDPTPMGWKEREWYLGEHATFGGPLFDRNGNVGPTIWMGGRVVGGWAQRPGGEVVWRLLQDIGSEGAASVEEEADRLTTWLSGEVVTPRFPTPLQKELAGG